MDIIFKYNIYLKICKRVGGKDTEEGERNRQKLDDIYNDLWEEDMEIGKWLKKHFKPTNDVMTSEHHIAYTNQRCQAVSNEIRKRLGKKGKYEENELLICRLYRKDDKGKFNVNIRWKILKVEGKRITIQNIKDLKDVRTVDDWILDKHFRYAYCARCHSRQGASVAGNLTIHEWNKDWLISKEWIWTAVMRTRDFNDVYYFDNERYEEHMNKELSKEIIKQYFQNKIEGYKYQDRKAGRELDKEDYIDVKWCVEKLKNGHCHKCGVSFDFEVKGSKISSNFTAQRMENSLAHTKDNCQSWCCYCNCSAS